MQKIQSLEQLAKEKQKLQLKMEVSKREFTHSLSNTQTEAKRFLVNKIVIPASVLGAAGFGLSKVIANNKKKKQEQHFEKSYTASIPSQKAKKSSFSEWKNLIIKLLPIGIQLFQTYFVVDDVVEEN